MYEKMKRSIAIIITIAAIVLIVPIMFSGVEPPVSVKAAATWPMTSEIEGKIPPASTAAAVPPMSRNQSKVVRKL
jgi:hypothetical protein